MIPLPPKKLGYSLCYSIQILIQTFQEGGPHKITSTKFGVYIGPYTTGDNLVDTLDHIQLVIIWWIHWTVYNR